MSRKSTRTGNPFRGVRAHGRPRQATAITKSNQAAQRLMIQPKLTVNRPGDRFEQQADQVADAIMRMPEPSVLGASADVSNPPIALQRMCADCKEEQSRPQENIQRLCSHCEDQLNSDTDQEGNLRAKESPGRSPELTPPAHSQIQAIRASAGQSLPPSARSFFEPRFGRSFADVRLHTDALAAESAQRVNALAYTVGRDIVFGANQFEPGTTGGRHLLAHELTHVVQQSGNHGNGGSQPMVRRMGDPAQAPASLSCPIATTSAANVDTSVLFTVNSPGLSAAGIADIAAFLGRWRAAGADRAVRVDGFASTDGPQPLNWTLSCDRASAVARELESPSSGAPGVPNSLIQVFAQGETSEFSTALEPNRRATISADLSAPPACANPGDSRSLDLQPVFLRTDPTDASPTGTSWGGRLGEANTIWGKVGVTFNDLGPITLDTPLKSSGTTAADRTRVRALRSGAGVEVFLVDNDMTTAGGADTAPPIGAGCGVTGNIVLSDRGTSNTLLAHELGHILGLDHPSDRPPFNPGDPGTIMEPSGSNSTPNPTRNTMVNFSKILCPAPTGSTCLHPDP
ncbi:MAG: DUF4157 domain-containing protein [Acidobacteriia bacterium]|nr:DUF4157 domain-containing protein [Terriglobia bacterium]